MIDPSRWESYAVAGAALSSQHRYDEAMEFFRKAQAHAPDAKRAELEVSVQQCLREKLYDAFGKSGTEALKEKRFVIATDDFQKAVQLFPKRTEYRFAQAVSLALAGNRAESAELLRQLKDSPDKATSSRAEVLLTRMNSGNGQQLTKPPRLVQIVYCARCSHATVPRSSSPAREPCSLAPYVPAPGRLALVSSSSPLALSRCDASPDTATRDRSAPAAPTSAHPADHPSSGSPRSAAPCAHSPRSPRVPTRAASG